MRLDYATLDMLRQHHPAWRLLRADHAALLASFLHRIFVAPNVRTIPQADLAEALEDELFGLREQLGNAAFPKVIPKQTGPNLRGFGHETMPLL